MSHAIDNARAWLKSVHEMVSALDAAVSSNDADAQDEKRDEIMELPLSLRVRGDWYNPGDEEKGGGPTEYELLLSTGGPALRLVGELDDYCQPTSARLEHQDWGTPWTELDTSVADDRALMTFAGVFYYGE